MNRIYLDTSVFGGYFDLEFALWTKILFDKIKKGEFSVIYSRLNDIELMNAPEQVRVLASSLPESQVTFVDVTDEAAELAEQYLKENVVGKTSRADCIHIALATLYNADILVSWNFKHIVNVSRIRGYNTVNAHSTSKCNLGCKMRSDIFFSKERGIAPSSEWKTDLFCSPSKSCRDESHNRCSKV